MTGLLHGNLTLDIPVRPDTKACSAPGYTRVITVCQPIGGGSIVVGRVADENDNSPLTSVIVESKSGEKNKGGGIS